jgi:hypothetical protein
MMSVRGLNLVFEAFRGLLADYPMKRMQLPDVMMEVSLNLLDQDTCVERIKSVAPDYNRDSMICAYEVKKDACRVRLLT